VTVVNFMQDILMRFQTKICVFMYMMMF